jgi:hypothetical protein
VKRGLAIIAFAFSPTILGAQETVDLAPNDLRLTMSTSPVYNIDGHTANEWAAFGRISALEFDHDGNLYILDGTSHRVVMVSSNGRFVREVGRQGDGPGEFRQPADLAVLSDNSLVVLDRHSHRAARFGRDGRY